MSNKEVRALAREFGYSPRAVRLSILVGEQILDDDAGEEDCDGREWGSTRRSGDYHASKAWKAAWGVYMTSHSSVMQG